MFLGIYIQGSRPSHPFKVVEPETVSSSQIYGTDGTILPNRAASTAANERRSTTESIGSERTNSSIDVAFQRPTIPGVLGLVGSESGSAVGMPSVEPPKVLCIESFVSRQVSKFTQILEWNF